MAGAFAILNSYQHHDCRGPAKSVSVLTRISASRRAPGLLRKMTLARVRFIQGQGQGHYR